MQKFLLDVWNERKDTIIFVTHNVDEAVFLSDNVLVLSERPARVLKTIPVDLSRPRNRTGQETNELRREILELLEEP